MKHIFIINPAAGKKDSRQRVYTMAEALKRNHNLDVECMLTKSRGHATALTRAIAETGDYVRFYACGGDGTVNEIANGIAGFPNAAMTCIPIGTGNDFLKNFGKDAEPLFLDAENLWNGDVTPLDLIDCNGKYCLTIACTGIDARIAESVHEFGASPMLSGRGSYLASVAVNFLFHKIGRRWRVTLDDEVIEDTFALVSMCNGRYYGGGSTPVPEARMTDGVLHTVLVKNVSKARFATLFGGYSAGDYKKLPQDIIRVSTAKVVRIEALEGDLTTCLGWKDNDSLPTTITTKLSEIMREENGNPNYGILHHEENVDLLPANLELSAMEMMLVTTMSRETVLRTYLNKVKNDYEYKQGLYKDIAAETGRSKMRFAFPFSAVW